MNNVEFNFDAEISRKKWIDHSRTRFFEKSYFMESFSKADHVNHDSVIEREREREREREY